ncbi:MAG: PfkB family carbohydrate kinase [Myxococcota bacterium]|nr:PfkB family carbohydrate kinase [Myxococcota bacterium]
MSWGSIPAAGKRALDLVGLGETSLDQTIELERMPLAGHKQRARGERTSPGGQIATAVLACSRLGLRCAFVGAVGDDSAADAALAPLRSAGVDLSALQRVAGGRTRQALVLVEGRGGERSVIGKRDDSVSIDAGALDSGLFERTRAVLLDDTDPEASLWAARAARESGAVVFLDADGPVSELEKLLPWVDFPVVSQLLAEEIGRGTSVLAGLEALCAAGARIAVATLGEYGAMALAGVGGRALCASAFEIEARDTNGAGDAFHAAWIAAALAAEDLEQALRMANAAAALNCVVQGAQGGLAGPEALARFLRTEQPGIWRDPR